MKLILALVLVRNKNQLNSLPAKFANSLDPDQARHFIGPDLDSNSLTPGW